MDRLIPARAGKTPSLSMRRTVVSAHPRAGGENSLRARRSVGIGGSSPRGRGKPRDQLVPGDLIGAHPRAGGENAVMNHPAAAALGSSPRGRGKRGHDGEG